MWLIQVLRIILVVVWERVENALEPGFLVLAHADQPVYLILAFDFPPVRPEIFRVDDNFKK